jgi:hypothetical protein
VVIFVTGESGIVEKDPAKGVPDFVLKILVQKNDIINEADFHFVSMTVPDVSLCSCSEGKTCGYSDIMGRKLI